MHDYLQKTAGLISVASFPVLLLTTAIPQNSALASNFGACASSLLESGISSDDAGVACADALEPTVLSACVAKIERETEITGQEALRACYRVRRPEELASCVVDIDNNLDSADVANLALDNCRRSLLPERFANCVVGLNRSISEFSGTEAIATCISAESFPTELFPRN